MAIFDTEKQRAAIVLLLLGIGIAIALAPYASGLLGVPVLYVLFAPLHRWLSRWPRPSIAAVIVIFIAFLLIVLPIGALRAKRAGAEFEPPLVPFGVFLAPAGLVALLWGDALIAAYLSLSGL